MMTNLDPTKSDPNAKAFLTKMQTDWGMDPAQIVDMNDPMTRVVMTIVIANIEQGRDLYSYDQFIKGCAMSAGVDPTLFDNEVNPTTLPIENNTSGAGGYVSVTATNIRLGGGSLPVLQLSQYIQMGIQMSLNTPGYSGISSGSTVFGPGGVTGAITGTGTFGNGLNPSAPIVSSGQSVFSGDAQTAAQQFADKWGINPNSVNGVIAIESGGNPAIAGGAGGNYNGIFQLQSSQVPSLTAAAGFSGSAANGGLTPAEYRQLSVADQFKVMDQYYQAANVPQGFFTGDAATDASKMWALQLAPGNATKIDYSNPDAVISRTNQAGAISARPGLVTVGSVQQGTLARGGAPVDSKPGSVTDPAGLPPGQYTTSPTIIDENGYDYKVLKGPNGTEYKQYTDGSIYDSAGENLIKPPNGIPPGFTNVDTQTINGQEVNVYTKEGSNEKYYQNDNTGIITNANGVVQSPSATGTPSPNGSIQVTELPNPNTGLTAAQQTAYNDVSGLSTVYAENAGKIDTLTAQNNDLAAQNAELQKTYDQNLNDTGVPDTSITEKINANQQIIDSNKATADSLNAQNTDLQTQIQTGTDQYAAATYAAGQTTNIPGVPGGNSPGGAAGGAPTAAASAASAAAMPSGC